MKFKPNEEKKLDDVIQEVIVEAINIKEEPTELEKDPSIKLLIGNIQKQIALAKLSIKSLEDYVTTLRNELYEDDN